MQFVSNTNHGQSCQLHLAMQAPPGSYRAASWPEDAVEPSTAHPGVHAAEAGAGAEKQGLPWRQRLPRIKADFDGGLREVVKGILVLLSDQVGVQYILSGARILTPSHEESSPSLICCLHVKWYHIIH